LNDGSQVVETGAWRVWAASTADERRIDKPIKEMYSNVVDVC
jgi:hypothetical protein